jgi:hypothetical protein
MTIHDDLFHIPAEDPDELPELTALPGGGTGWRTRRDVRRAEDRAAFEELTRSATTSAARGELAGGYRVLVGVHRGHVVTLDGGEARLMLLGSLVERIEDR